MMDRTVIRLEPQHRSAAVATLAAAFQDDPAVSWIIPDAAERTLRLPRMFSWLWDDHQRHGIALGTPGGEAVTLWRLPGKVHHHDPLWPPELARLLGSQRFGADFTVLNAGCAGLQRMQLGHFQGLGGQVDAQHLRPFAGHGIGQNASTAAHVDYPLSCQVDQAMDPLQTQRIDLVQGAKFAFRVPPAMGQIGKLGQFGRIDVGVAHAAIVAQATISNSFSHEKSPVAGAFLIHQR